VSFGELRQAIPEIFTVENDRDRVLVPLPLGEILCRLNPALLSRRRVQRQVEVPAEICSPFDTESQGLVPPASPAMPEAEPASPAAPPRSGCPIPSEPVSFARQGLSSVPTPPPPAALPLSTPPWQGLSAASPPPPPSALPPIAPLRPGFPSKGLPPVPGHPPVARLPLTPVHYNLASAPPSSPPPAAAPEPAPPPSMSPPPGFAPLARPVVPPARNDTHSAAASLPASQPLQMAGSGEEEAEPLVVGLARIGEGWPETVRKEIVELNLVDVKVALPASAVEQALRQGRVAFSWKTLRSWFRPAIAPAVSPYDATVLELPLKIVAPIFLARQREASKAQQKKVKIDEEIPNLFFGFPQPESAGPGSASSAQPPAGSSNDTNYYVWDEASDRARVDESDTKRGPSPGTKFVAKYATPNEVISRAAALEGVAGALIALPDGLMVASRLAPDLNGDTLAAFLPQIFSKVSQCTKELRMGELNNLNFTVGNIPWKIFRVNAIFFAAFGRTGQALPTAQLAALAAELDHKPK
jgi:predicted regulator of Ras-like GTPase activity (Roadblock/LC7/MglB family)